MKRLFGGILLAIGILIAGASGLCTLIFVGSSTGQPNDLGPILPLALIFGGLPFLVGIGLIIGGRALLKSARMDDEGLY
ncbi:hypothetical protein [Sphingomonas sp.]|jgi:hypothetical protein|uniref:hypothetical protein n=1 Tax=Sphingomonas sp. TaxID=28214 RepID=UPI002DB76A4E|nr:hypothetical protein [Sphingomonas sp.]HEU4969438.1 hypothetical protein [Sphingomonas sp.]